MECGKFPRWHSIFEQFINFLNVRPFVSGIEEVVPHKGKLDLRRKRCNHISRPGHRRLSETYTVSRGQDTALQGTHPVHVLRINEIGSAE